jgi:preprotein translocase subunit SecG
MVQNPKGGGLSSIRWFSNVRWSSKQLTFLDKSTWTLATILIALILLSSLSFTGTLSDTDSKIIDNTETAAPVAPVTPIQDSTSYNNSSYIIKMPACQSWHFL